MIVGSGSITRALAITVSLLDSQRYRAGVCDYDRPKTTIVVSVLDRILSKLGISDEALVEVPSGASKLGFLSSLARSDSLFGKIN